VPTFEELLERWDGEQVVIRHDRESGAWIFICMHSTRLGPAGGGTRMKVYDTPTDGLADAMRLAEGMTSKLAVAGIGLGGGKAVIAVPELPHGERRRALLHRYGDMVASLGGNFRTGADVNTGEADMDAISERTDFAFGLSKANGGAGDPGGYTALGVLHGIRSSLAHALGSSDLRGRSVLVQGAGSVGSALAELLAEAGASVLVADLDAERAAAVAESTGGLTVPADEVIGTECDVYAPCALGGTLSAVTVPRLRCKIIAGSANNQLAEPRAAELLRDRGILYAPDYVINAGGAIAIVGLEQQARSAADIDAALARIGTTLNEIYERADADGITTAAAADAVAAVRLAV
jgi:leucine dehydrogenase